MKKSFNVCLQSAARRRGAVAVFVALLMIPLLGFVALCVDIGWVTTTKSTLQNAADSAAAAGASQLVDYYGTYSTATTSAQPSLISSAKSSATTYGKKFCAYNGSGGVTSLNLLTNDVVFGFTDASNNFTSTYSGYPNTAKVTVRRDATANGRLPFFFATAMGRHDTALAATASMTIYTGLITAFGPPSSVPGGVGAGSSDGAWGDGFWTDGADFDCDLLPVAFDVDHWNTFFASGMSPDGTIHTGTGGNKIIQIYPSPKQSPGNFGLLNIGHWTNATPDFRNWVLDGPTVSDLQYLSTSGQFPVSLTAPKAWKGTPGLRTTLSNDFSAIIGQPRLLPLFKPASTSPYQAASGNGSNTTYSIVGFAGVTVTSVSGAGVNLSICVQPCSVLDPTAVFDSTSIYPVGAQPAGQLKTFTFLSPRLSR